MSRGTPGRGERAAHAGDRAAAGADQDGHLAPGHAVLQVGAAQDVGDVVELGAGGRVGVRPRRGRRPVPAASSRWARTFAGGQAGQRHPAGEQPGGGQQAGAGAAGGA